jgi:hypothetical protein
MVGKNENMFFTIGFCVGQILGIIRSQIQTNKILSLVGILTSYRRCHLQ